MGGLYPHEAGNQVLSVLVGRFGSYCFHYFYDTAIYQAAGFRQSIAVFEYTPVFRHIYDIYILFYLCSPYCGRNIDPKAKEKLDQKYEDTED